MRGTENEIVDIEKNKKIFQIDKNDLNGKLGSDIQCIKNPLR